MRISGFCISRWTGISHHSNRFNMSKLHKIFEQLRRDDIDEAISLLKAIDSRMNAHPLTIEPFPDLLHHTIEKAKDSTEDKLFIVLLFVLQCKEFRILMCKGEEVHRHKEMMKVLETVFINYVSGYHLFTGEKYNDKEPRMNSTRLVYELTAYFMSL